MERKDTENKRYICLVRASDTSEGTTSTEAQIAFLKEYGQRMGMIFVDQIVLDGVTGSLPGKREDLQQLLARKRQKNDFDVVLLQRMDRLTRGGSAHGFWFEHECHCVGIHLSFVGDDIPDGRYANLIKVAKYEAAQEQSQSISQRSTQGSQLAMEEGRNITSGHTPLGCWRLYLTAAGEPSHIIIDLRDGRQQKLHPHTLAIIDTYGQIGGGGKGHYRKQKSEKVLLMPGNPAEVDTVRQIFDLHFRQGYGGKRIADVLNRQGIRSPQGKKWSQHQVEVIYEQEAYTGRSVGNRTSSAIYHERHAKAPKRVILDSAVQATARNIPVRQRPRDEWFVQDQPLMEDFLLDPELRKLAMAEHERLWQRRSDVDRPKRSKSKHQASDYLLTGLLVAQQDGESLVGVLCGRVGNKVRYYRHRRGNRDYVKGGIYSRMIAAKPLEEAVLALVSDMLHLDEGLRDRIIAAVEAEAGRTIGGDTLIDLQQRREKLKQRAEWLVAALDAETLAEARVEFDRLKSERRALDEQIAVIESTAAVRSIDPQKLADAVLGDLRQMAQNVAQMPTFVLRQLLGSVVQRVSVDMETKAAEVQLMLPLPLTKNFSRGSGDAKPMRPVGTPASSTCDETHPVLSVHLGAAKCEYAVVKRKPCFECRRLKAAA